MNTQTHINLKLETNKVNFSLFCPYLIQLCVVQEVISALLLAVQSVTCKL